MKKIFVILVLLASAGHAQERNNIKQNVLLIGNSLTYYNEMPAVLQEMLNETDPHINVEQITFPGMSLDGHLKNIVTSRTENGASTRQKKEGELTATEKKISEKKWDVIVVQTGGVGVLIPEARELQIKPAIEKIKNMVADSNTRIILFTTWASKGDYPVEYCYPGRMIDPGLEFNKEYCSPELVAAEQQVALLKEGYCTIAEETEIEMTFHGDLYPEIEKDNPAIGLLEDSMHPSPTGAFLNAGVFYQMLTGKNVSALKYNGELPVELATTLKSFADPNYRF